MAARTAKSTNCKSLYMLAIRGKVHDFKQLGWREPRRRFVRTLVVRATVAIY